MAQKATKKKSMAAKRPSKKLGSKHQQSIAHFQEVAKLMDQEEELLPELKRFRKHQGTFLEGIYHPLLQCSTYREGHFAYVNFCFRAMQKQLGRFRKEKNFYSAVFCYTTPYLLQGFAEEAGDADDKTYWKILGAVWVQCESPWPNRKLFLQLFNGPRPHREHLMRDDERKALKKLPAQLTIYRGFGGDRGKGLSWTLDRDKAIWFAKRFHEFHRKPGRVIEGTCQKADVFAHFTGRSESEIVIDPAKVKGQSRVPLEAWKAGR